MDNFLKVLIGQQHQALYNWDILKHNVWSEFFIFYQRVGGAVNTDDIESSSGNKHDTLSLELTQSCWGADQ